MNGEGILVELIKSKSSHSSKGLSSSDGVIEDTEADREPEIRFVFRYIIYLYNTATRIFEPVQYDYKTTYDQIHVRSDGVHEDDVPGLVNTFGKGTMELSLKPWYTVLMDEVINPYYILQMFSVVIWFLNEYYRSGIVLSKPSESNSQCSPDDLVCNHCRTYGHHEEHEETQGNGLL